MAERVSDEVLEEMQRQFAKQSNWTEREREQAVAAIDELLACRRQEPYGYVCDAFDKGATTLYEVPQESLFGRDYKNQPVYAAPVAAEGWGGLLLAVKKAHMESSAFNNFECRYGFHLGTCPNEDCLSCTVERFLSTAPEAGK